MRFREEKKYLQKKIAYIHICCHRPTFGSKAWLCRADPGGRHCQVGSLAGAAHLLKDNAGVLRWAQWEQKSRVEQKDKSSFDSDFLYEYEPWKCGLSIL